MDVGEILTAVGVISTGLGGFMTGRLSGRSTASQIASDTVGMLQAQVEVLESDKERRELEILDLNNRVAVLEGLVTQRAPVEELSNKVDDVREAVGRIEAKVGTCERHP